MSGNDGRMKAGTEARRVKLRGKVCNEMAASHSFSTITLSIERNTKSKMGPGPLHA